MSAPPKKHVELKPLRQVENVACEREAQVMPDSMLNDNRRKPVTTV
jgi:hypothetical protein